MTIRFAHTNIAARDWKRLVEFYCEVFGCTPVPPERDLSGGWLDRATALDGARLRGMHLRLPGHGENGPTLEIFQYDHMLESTPPTPNTPGFGHIAFQVDDVDAISAMFMERGGSAVGTIERRTVEGVGLLTMQYARDPEGNIVEIQSWE